jgi:hypothetical protein
MSPLAPNGRRQQPQRCKLRRSPGIVAIVNRAADCNFVKRHAADTKRFEFGER